MVARFRLKDTTDGYGRTHKVFFARNEQPKAEVCMSNQSTREEEPKASHVPKKQLQCMNQNLVRSFGEWTVSEPLGNNVTEANRLHSSILLQSLSPQFTDWERRQQRSVRAKRKGRAVTQLPEISL
jgi:hypothetical protein